METPLKNRFKIIMALVWGTMAIVFWATDYFNLVIGGSIGVLMAAFNFASLLSHFDQTDQKGKAKKVLTNSQLTQRFVLRYAVLAIIFVLLIQYGQQHLFGFMIGFAALYVVLFLDYMLRMKKKARSL